MTNDEFFFFCCYYYYYDNNNYDDSYGHYCRWYAPKLNIKWIEIGL